MTTEIICLQDALPIAMIINLDLETFIKGPHVYKDIWSPKQGEQLNVLMEPDNRMDKKTGQGQKLVQENECSSYPRFK